MKLPHKTLTRRFTMKPYTHFTLSERICLEGYLKEGKGIREIGRLMKRSPSTISREVKRNKSKKGYNFWRATSLYIHRRKKSVRKPVVLKNKRLYDRIIEMLNLFWSPEIISNRLKKEGLSIAAATIYRAIRKGLIPNITVKTHLRRRGKRKCKDRSKFNTIHPEHTIHDRPDIIENKERFGDFEGDTVCSSKSKYCLVTQVDRKSRLLTASISENHTKEQVRKAVKRAFELIEIDIPVLSITLDNGSEFADFKGIEEDLNTTIYFADPHSPWQRGLNENTNDMLRFFFPKGTDFSKVTEDELLHVVNLINSRPRKCLNFLSPIEFLSKKCCT